MDTSQKIKQSLCLRAKYRVYPKKVLSPLLVVPHPKNRGGDPVKSLRTMQLNATVAVEGYDPMEANCNAVVVEDKPVVAGGSGQYFQEEFAKKVMIDPDMAEQGSGMVATAGSLSHSHLNCCMRNILCCKKGCECPEDKTQCECGSQQILDHNGNYSLEKLRVHDAEWALGCFRGLEWEVLSWRMDIEEPDAAQIISIALNKKNEVAMKTGHLEIMSTLVSLCEPTPDMSVPFEPVRDKLIDLYGAAVDHPDFLHAFRLVIDAGGAGSVHMQDLETFTAVHVNQKLRKMRMEVYAVVAPYPVDFPKIKNACLKWSWRQTPHRGWCQVPPSILHRLTDDSKFGMYDFMLSVELAMAALSKLTSTVVEIKDLKSRTKWIAEVEINLMCKIFAWPKKELFKGKTVLQQQEELCEQCAALIATKLLDLAKLGKPDVYRAGLSGLTRDSALMKRVGEHLDDPASFLARDKKEAEQTPEVAGPLVPKVIEMDADGRPVTEHETVPMQAPREKPVELIPWSTWADTATKRNPNNTAKLLLWMAIDDFHHNWSTPCPIALVRKGSVIQANATKPLRIGELVVPLFVKKQHSVVTEDEGASVHPKAVDVVVTWSESATAVVNVEDADGNSVKEQNSVVTEGEGATVHPKAPDVAVRLKVQPELKFPVKGAKGLQWTQFDAVHPFWFIQRADKIEMEANADLVMQDFTHITACSYKAVTSGGAQVLPITDTFSVSVPFIVNTQAIAMGEEVILKWKPQESKRKHVAVAPNAFDQIRQQDRRERKAKTN